MSSKPHSFGESTPTLLIGLFVIGLLTIPIPSTALTINGQLSLQGNAAATDSDSILTRGSNNSLFDASGMLRLMVQEESRDSTFSLHYEISAVGGDLFEQSTAMESVVPGRSATGSLDSLKVFNLDQTLTEADRYRFQHRIDRLSYQYHANWGTVTVGRDVVTWGNGLVFNPLDLLNPFAPQDIQRDYKVGDDMVLVDLYEADWTGDMSWQILAVPHRNPLTGKLEKAFSSLAVKTHFFKDASEWDLLIAMHYDEFHLGLGSAHTIGSAVMRADLLAAFPENGETLVSAILNVDFSWTTAGLNTYGYLEYYYQSVGVNSLQGALLEPALFKRLGRGEIYTYGRHYLASGLQVEFHPLLQAHVSGIINIEDQSLIVQPYLIWDARQNLQFAIGATLSDGSHNTEFGPSEISDTAGTWKSPNTLFTWLKWYF